MATRRPTIWGTPPQLLTPSLTLSVSPGQSYVWVSLLTFLADLEEAVFLIQAEWELEVLWFL